MKKKIKDLTLEEKKKICEKYANVVNDCLKCPLCFKSKWCLIKVLEREVEVDE